MDYKSINNELKDYMHNRLMEDMQTSSTSIKPKKEVSTNANPIITTNNAPSKSNIIKNKVINAAKDIATDKIIDVAIKVAVKAFTGI